MATNLYNPNTGALLKPGETVWDIANNKLITQGTEAGTGVAYTAAQNAAAQAGSAPKAAAPVAPVVNPAPVYKAPVANPVATAPAAAAPVIKPIASVAPAVTPAAAPVAAPVAPISSYSGSSIVDFLNQSGQSSTFAARSALATRYGIANYTGTADQNTQLLGILKGQTATAPTMAQTPATGQPGTTGTQAGTQANNATGQPVDVEAIKAKIEQVKQQIATAQTQYDKEVGVQNLVQEAAKLGLDYPTDYLNSLITPEKSDAEMKQAIYDKYGITNLETSAWQAPEKTYSQIYTQALADLNLTKYNDDLTAAQTEMDKATADYDAAVAENNKNPWLSESGRTGQVRRIYEAYSAEATRLQAKVTLAQNRVDQIKEDAKTTATQTVAELTQNQQLDQEKLSYLTQKAEADLTAQKEAQKQTTAKEMERYYPYYVKNLATGSSKTQIVNIGGQEILYAYDDSGKVVSKTVLGQAGSGTKTTDTSFKFSSTDQGILLSAGFAQSDIANIQNDLNNYGYDQTTAGMNDKQKKAVSQILSGATPTQTANANQPQFLNEDYFKTMYGSTLDKAAKDAGFTIGGVWGVGATGDTTAYLADLMSKISLYRESGYTDKEIIALMK